MKIDINGTLYIPENIQMCNTTIQGLRKEDKLVFVILRGNCTFTEKIRNVCIYFKYINLGSKFKCISNCNS